ncbi:MAG: RCC1 domain-containing protein [Bacteroidota bacterium]
MTGGKLHAITAGIAHTCAITPEGGVQCWGNNDYGQLGDGTNKGSNVPVNVLGIRSGRTITAGGNHTCVLSGGEVWCWGSNYYGQLGTNSQASSSIPQAVLKVSAAWQLAVGKYHACVMLTIHTPGTDDIQCWGLNKDDQLGNGTYENSAVPVFVK